MPTRVVLGKQPYHEFADRRLTTASLYRISDLNHKNALPKLLIMSFVRREETAAPPYPAGAKALPLSRFGSVHCLVDDVLSVSLQPRGGDTGISVVAPAGEWLWGIPSGLHHEYGSTP